MSFPLVTRWFERRRVSDDITLLWEPHVVPLKRCNIWHVRGRDRDLDYCTTMERLLDLPVTVVHGGHDPSFGRDRLREIARTYLESRQRTP